MNHATDTHTEWEELVALHALEGLEPAEAQRLEQHLATCADCQAALADYQGIAGRIQASVPLVQAPASIERRLLRRVQQQRLRRSLRWVATAAALLILALGGGYWWGRQTAPLSASESRAATAVARIGAEKSQILQLSATTGLSASARCIWVFGESQASLIVAGLPPAAAGQTYQTWFVLKDQTVLASTTFQVDATGAAVVQLVAPAPWPDLAQMIITSEPQGGSLQPSTPTLLAGTF